MAGNGVSSPLASRYLKRGAFVAFLLGFLALAAPAVVEPMTFWTGIVLGDYAYPTHELHHLVLASVFGLLLLGVIVQAIRPARGVGALHSSILVWGSLTVVFAGTGDFSPMHLVLLGLLVGALLAHPAGRSQVPDAESVTPVLAAVCGVTALGALLFAGVELDAHRGSTDGHAALGHYQFMATTGLSIAALSAYGSLRGTGWRFPIYGSAALLAVIGIASIAYPGAEQGSSLGVGLGAVVVGWAVMVVLIAERGEALVRWGKR